MKYYTWGIHDNYARYWTKEFLENNEELGVLHDKAYAFLVQLNNPLNFKKWNPPILKEEIEISENGQIVGKRKKGDMHSTWRGHSYIISQNMINKIGNILKKYGVLFPLEIEDREEKFYRYWVTYEKSFKCIDILNSKTSTSEEISSQEKLVELFGEEEKPHLEYLKDKYRNITETFNIYKLILKKECEDDALIFRITNVYSNTVFVTDDFINLLKENDLKGFNFKLDTSYNSFAEDILLG